MSDPPADQLLGDAIRRGHYSADVIVELHDFAHPDGVTEAVVARFRDTHEVRLVEIEPRDPAAFPGLQVLPEAQRADAISEARATDTRWAWLRART